MNYEEKNVETIIEEAREGKIVLPEFQRAFVWDSEMIAELADSLYKEYPIGMLIFWEKDDKLYVIDGLQRILSFCLMVDRKPKWMGQNEWEKLRRRHKIGVYYDGSKVEFSKITRDNANKLCPLSELLKTEDIISLAQDYASRFNLNPNKVANVFNRIINNILKYKIKICKIPSSYDFATISEIFERINKSGVEVDIADIIIARIVGTIWRDFRDEFDQFIKYLIEKRYITDAKLYKTGILQIFLTIVNPNNPDISSLLKKNKRDLQECWNKTKEIILDVFSEVRNELGIVPRDLKDIKPFTILCLLHNKFGYNVRSSLPYVLRWFILRIINPYSGTGPFNLDIEKVNQSEYLSDAITKLCEALPPPSSEDLILNSKIGSRVSTILKVLCFKTDARDFKDKDMKVNDEGISKHHFFPKKLLDQHNKADRADLLPNCVYISNDTNKQIGTQEPYRYVEEFNLSDDELKRHLLPLDRDLFRVTKYDQFIKERAKIITKALKNYLTNLENNKNKVELDKTYI